MTKPIDIANRILGLKDIRDALVQSGEPVGDMIDEMVSGVKTHVQFYVRSTALQPHLGGAERDISRVELPFSNLMVYFYDQPIMLKGRLCCGVYLHKPLEGSIVACVFRDSINYDVCFLDQDFLDTGEGYASSNASSLYVTGDEIDSVIEDGDSFGTREVLLGFINLLGSKSSKFTTYEDVEVTRVPKLKNPNKLKTVKSSRRIFYVEDAKRVRYHSSLDSRVVNWTHRWPRKAHYRRLHNTESIGKDSNGERNQVGRTWVVESICGPADAELLAAIRVVR